MVLLLETVNNGGITPVFLYFQREMFKNILFLVLALVFLLCLVYLLKDHTFDRSRLWNTRAYKKHLSSIIKKFLLGALMIILLVLVIDKELFLSLPRQRPGIWLMVMVIYPVVSVYPQEIIFRTFLFQRYQTIFKEETLIRMSGFSFGIAHLFYGNLIAPVLSALGGFLFAGTYQKTRSTFFAAFEHALWGDLIFTVGWGWYFYSSAIP
ncbi:MAG: CPBP family intramembrane metalloprotease [Caldithrix sp.]|nr:CPBP family intramembrane metalloprotease [Caldithrix sp.]